MTKYMVKIYITERSLKKSVFNMHSDFRRL